MHFLDPMKILNFKCIYISFLVCVLHKYFVHVETGTVSRFPWNITKLFVLEDCFISLSYRRFNI